MGGGSLGLVADVAWILGVPLVVTAVFIVLPILVAKNAGGTAGRLSVLPGISASGGLRAGVVMFAYPLVVLAVVGASVTVVTEVIEDEPAIDDGSGGEQSTGADTDDGSEDDAEGQTGSDDSDDDSGTEPGVRDGESYGPLADQVDIQVYEVEERFSNRLDEGTLILYDPGGSPIEEQNITADGEGELFSFNYFDDLMPGLNYTASVTGVDSWPTVNVSFDPADYGENKLNIIVGYELTSVDSHRSVFIDNFTEIEDRGRFLQAGYAVYAENGDAVLKTTNAEHSVGSVEGRWIDVTYTDGETNETYYNAGDGWEVRPDKHLSEPRRPTKQQFPERTGIILHEMEAYDRKYVGQTTLNGSSVTDVLPEEPLEDRVPQINEVEEAHQNLTVDVFYYENFSTYRTDMWIYVDAETKHVVRMEYADRQTRTGDPIWVTIDYWDHGKVESIDDYDVSELSS